MDLEAQATGIGALADDTRRTLYEYVSAQPEPVSREQAATALGIAQHNVNFHLDRLVADGLLEVEYRRLSGKRGPGAGRPSKLYRRAQREFAVSLPPRRYDLVAGILATAVVRARDGEALDDALRDTASVEGRALGASAPDATEPAPLPKLAAALERQGYEPRVDDDVLELVNCPFDALAQTHTALVCGLNHAYVQGVVDGLECHQVDAHLEPEPGRCCVKARVRT